jgi:hypothetical protein
MENIRGFSNPDRLKELSDIVNFPLLYIRCSMEDNNLSFESVEWLIESKKKLQEQYGMEKWFIFVYEYIVNAYFYNYDHFFGHLYQILKYIRKNEKQNMGKRKRDVKKKFKYYAGIVQSQLSTPELYVLLYNGIAYPRLKKLLIRYKFLENFTKYTPDGQRLKDVYEQFYTKLTTEDEN